MNIPQINNCPGTLAAGFSTYSRSCLNNLFNGKKVSHLLPYDPPQVNDADAQAFLDNRERISISGVQEKLSLVLDGQQLRLSKAGEQGTYLLKPIPRDLKKIDQVPANEHLTMQIARQVYNISTAENALIFFKNGEPAYLTRRFDVRPDGKKWRVEDFASLAGMTKASSGAHFKYNYSYEALANFAEKYIPAYRVEIEKLFKLVVFNFLFSNGDAHLKNFSLMETASGDFLLSPAYDLINTRIHVDDSVFALSDGLFKDDFKSDYYKKRGFPSQEDFKEFSNRIGIQRTRYEKLMAPFLAYQKKVETLIEHSFLSPAIKRAYMLHYQTRRNHLNH
jgi:serine/threonine-protein kinase HipA